MKTLLLFLFVGVAAVYSQVPERCYAPRRFEARVERFEPTRQYFLNGFMSYDASNMRFRIKEEVDEKLEKEFYDVLYLHNTMPGKEYRLNLKTKQCETRMLNYPFRPFEVPENATSFGEFTIGTKGQPGYGVDVQAWQGRTPEGGEYMSVYTLDGCVPVNDHYYSNETGRSITQFYDVTLGISDPNIFIPPRECME